MRARLLLLLGFVLTACASSETSSANKGPGRPTAVTCGTSSGECRTDADCGATAVCGCGVGIQGQNICLTQSRCKVDSDCASGEKCNLSLPFIYSAAGLDSGTGRYGGVTSGSELGGFSHSEALGYFCTTPKDVCVPDAAGGTVANNAVGACVFGADHWIVGSMP
jgi:hypothetical protein